MRKEFNSHRIGLVHQYGRRFIVLVHFFFCQFYWTQTCPAGIGTNGTHRSHARCPPLPPTPKTRPDQHTGNSMPYSLRFMCGFFNVPQGYEHSSVVRRDLRFIVLNPRRLESLTICRCHYKGST